MSVERKSISKQNIKNVSTFILDTDERSKYFGIVDFKYTFDRGKNLILINGSQYLQQSSEIRLEILDSRGNPIYYEGIDGSNYFIGNSNAISVFVYDDTPVGIGSIAILGIADTYIQNSVVRGVPIEWKDKYNVKWVKDVQITNRTNSERVILRKTPFVTVTEITKPQYVTQTNVVTANGYADGTSIFPNDSVKYSNNYRPTLYRIVRSSGDVFNQQMLGSKIVFPNNSNYTATIIDVVSDSELFVTPEYRVAGNVSSLSGEYQVQYQFTDDVVSPGGVAESYAKIDIKNLETFSGKVDVVKLYRKSNSNIADYQLINEIKVKPIEYLRDIYATGSVDINYGNFKQEYLQDGRYWITGSYMSASFDNTFLINSAKLTNLQPTVPSIFYTSASYSLVEGSKYNVSFNVRRPTDGIGSGYLRVYLSGSYSGSGLSQDVITLDSNELLYQYTPVSKEIQFYGINNVRLYFETTGTEWYVNNIRLSSGGDQYFGYYETTLIDYSLRTFPSESFKYNLDLVGGDSVNIPIDINVDTIFSDGAFGNGLSVIELRPDLFNFYFDNVDGEHIPLYPSSIDFNVLSKVDVNLINITSGAYSRDGVYIDPSEYAGGQYPGLLDGLGTLSLQLSISNFTGSNDAIDVGYIEYAANITGFDGQGDVVVIGSILNGQDAKVVTINATTNVVVYDGDSILQTPVEPIELEAVVYNETQDVTYYQFFKDDIPVTPISTNNVYIISSGDMPFPNVVSVYRVEVRSVSTSNPVSATDEINIYGVKAGADVYHGYLTNPNKTLTFTTSSGVLFNNSSTQIIAYKGIEQLSGVVNFTNTQLNPVTGLNEPSLGQYSASIWEKSNHITASLLQTSSVSPHVYEIGNLIGWDDPETNRDAYITYRVTFENAQSADFTQYYNLVANSGDFLGYPVSGSNGVRVNLVGEKYVAELGGTISGYANDITIDDVNDTRFNINSANFALISIGNIGGSRIVQSQADRFLIDSPEARLGKSSSNSYIEVLNNIITISSVFDGYTRFAFYGAGTKTSGSLGKLNSGYIAGFATDGTIIEIPTGSISGVAGTSGTSGTGGTSGTRGTSGTGGTSGTRGTSGTSGINGTSGTSGINGTSGTSGVNGSPGTGGTSGTSGTNAGASVLNDLNDVSITSAVNGQILKYNNGTWGNVSDDGGKGVAGTNGITVLDTGTNYVVGLGGALTGSTVIDLNSKILSVYEDSYEFGLRMNPNSFGSIEVNTGEFGYISMYGYGSGIKGVGNFLFAGQLDSGYLAGFATDGTLVEIPTASLISQGSGDGTSGTSGTNGSAGTSGVDGTSGTSATLGDVSLNDLDDVVIANTPSVGQVLKYNGVSWVSGSAVNGTNGLTTVQSGADYTIKLGGNLTENTVVDGNAYTISLESDTQVRLYGGVNSFISLNNISTQLKGTFIQSGGSVVYQDYGEGNKTLGLLSKFDSGYVAGFATDGTIVDIPTSSLTGNVDITATNGLTLSGTTLKLGGTLTEFTTVGLSTNTLIFGQGNVTYRITPGSVTPAPVIANHVLEGTSIQFAGRGSGTYNVSLLGTTQTNYIAGFDNLGNVVEINKNTLSVGGGSAFTISTSTDNGSIAFTSAQQIHELTISGVSSLSISFSNPVTGGYYILRITISGGSKTVTFPAGFKYVTGVDVGAYVVTGNSAWTFYYNGSNYYVMSIIT